MNKSFVRSVFCAVLCGTLLLAGCGEEEKKDLSLKRNNPRNIKGVWSYKKVFNDQNDVQLPMAQSLGIPLIEGRAEAEHMKKKLQKLDGDRYYTVDSLTHSIPYLIPRAANCLDTIGARFIDSLGRKGLNPYRITVTSVLRTREDVRKLRTRNLNALENSAHVHGTTFDISWKRFQQIPDPDGRPLEPVAWGTLKLVLSEVLRDMQEEKRCYVKYELKQGCFHITTR